MPSRLLAQRASVRSALAGQEPRAVPRPYGGKRYYGAYTWLAKIPEALGADDFFSNFPTKPFERTSSTTSVPIILATPGLANYLDPSNPFLEILINKLYNKTGSQSEIYAAAAVIDKIPCATGKDSNGAIASEEHEGLSILIAEEADLQWKALPPSRIKGPSGEEPSLAVAVRGTQTNQGHPGPAHEVGLRLANTVFVNGKERTFLGMHWSADKDGSKLSLNQIADLTSCSVSSREASISSGLTLPLYPVGKRRTVITGMGNILRQLSKSADSGSLEPMPASTELETELPRYIKEHNITDQRVSVWALVEKPDVKVSGQSSTQDRLFQSLRQGGKLHRVMSGGGGWGKKQGLLSLDPEIAFPSAVRPNSSTGLDQIFNPAAEDDSLELPSFFLDNGLIGEDLSHLSQVANPGDFIEFFVAVEPKAHEAQLPSADVRGSTVSYAFGVVSDAEEAEAPGNHGEEKSFVGVPNHFGALSEKAITYSQPVLIEGDVVDSSTKLDIPGCRVVLESQ